MSKYWTQTLNGGIFDIAELENEVRQSGISLPTICHALTGTQRFRAMSTSRFTVATHSIGVASIAIDIHRHTEPAIPARSTRIELLGLLHDAHEAYLGDMPAPIKKYIRDVEGFDWAAMEDRVQSAILKVLNVPLPSPEERAIIKKADMIALKLERDRFMPSSLIWEIDETEVPAYIRWKPRVDYRHDFTVQQFFHHLERTMAQEAQFRQIAARKGNGTESARLKTCDA